MNTTVKQYIESIANNDKNPELSQRDFLIEEAKKISMSRCNGDLQCGINTYRSDELLAKSNPSYFIDKYLGPVGTFTRSIAEMRSYFDLMFAKQHAKSVELYSKSKYRYGKEMIGALFAKIAMLGFLRVEVMGDIDFRYNMEMHCRQRTGACRLYLYSR